jgi:ABC-2 type transport system permease protein
MIWRIAQKEFIEMTRDQRFRTVAGIVLGLLFAALLVGSKHALDVSTQHAAAQRATRAQWLAQTPKNPHSAAHYGVYAFKPKPPLSFADWGVDDYAGVAVWLEAHKQNDLRYKPAQDATAVQRFSALTAATVLQLLVPLAIILIAFATFAGEREQGTLRQVLSLGVDGRELALGKALGVTAALAALLVPATVIGVGALALAAGPGALVADLPRFGLLALAYLVYFLVFVGLSLAVSAWAKSARLALVVLLGFWIFQGLVAPRVAADAARRLHPTPSALAFAEAMRQDIEGGTDGHDSRDQRLEALKARLLRQYKVTSVDQIPVNFAGIALQVGEEHGNAVFDRHYGDLWARFRAQDAVHRWGGLLAPLLAVRSLSMGLAGTDGAQHRHFAAAAEEYRRRLIQATNDEVTFHKDEDHKATAAFYRSVPDFVYTAPAATQVLQDQGVSALGLGLWLAASAFAAVTTARRLQVN